MSANTFASEYLSENMANSLDEVTDDEFDNFKAVKFEEVIIKEEAVSNMEEEYEDDYAKDYNSISMDDYVKVEFPQTGNSIEDNMMSVHKTVQEPAISTNKELHTSDALFYCGECGTEYESYCTKCPMLLHILHSSVSDNIEGGGKGTLPKDILFIKKSLDRLGVFALKTIPKGVIFGPFYGLMSVQSTTGCFLKLRNGKPVYPNDVNSLNWMQYIFCTENVSHKNLVSFQHEGNLYYQSDREIRRGEELLVCYSDGCDDNIIDVETYYRPDIKSEIEKVYACTFCCLGFSSEFYLLKHKTKCPHTTDNEAPKEIIQCPFTEIYLDKKEYREYHSDCSYQKYSSKWISSVKSDRPIGILKHMLNSHRKFDRKYSCSSCTYSTDHEFLLKRHVLTHNANEVKEFASHSDKEPFECAICKEQFTQRHHLKEHMSVHGGENPLECEICKKCFAQKLPLTAHLGKYSREKPFICDFCNKSKGSRTTLSTPLLAHTEEKSFECEICKKCFRIRSHLTEHLRIHSGEKPFKCEFCTKSFVQWGGLNKHLRTHTGERPFVCEICKKSFAQKSYLTAHTLTHTGGGPFACEICNKGFSRKSNLKQHHRIHTEERPFRCEICKKGFTQKVSLDLHIGTHSGEKPFECETCKKRFTYRTSLNAHVRTHAGEKPFECEICKKGFTRNSFLKVHMRHHTGEKPFECEICKKCFTQRSSLALHMHIHSGDKPFQCQVCNKSFGHPGNLRRHVLTHITEGTEVENL